MVGANVAKPWYESKVIWVNAVAFAVFILQAVLFQNLIVDPLWEALIVAVLNILLRFKTDQAVKL